MKESYNDSTATNNETTSFLSVLDPSLRSVLYIWMVSGCFHRVECRKAWLNSCFGTIQHYMCTYNSGFGSSTLFWGAIYLPSSFFNIVSGYNSQSHKFDLQNSLIAAVQCFSVIFSTNSSLILSLSWLASITVWWLTSKLKHILVWP